jgi:drug/metabolite transporter (DMT)-like permease
MWLVFAAAAGVFYSCESLLHRFLLRDQKDAWAFSFFYSFIGAAIALPFMLAAPQLPGEALPWLLAVLVGLLIVAHNLLVFKSSNYLEASIVGSLAKIRFVWIFVLGIVFLDSSFSWPKLLGVVITIAAGVVIIHSFKRPKSLTGVALVLGATVFNALIVILTKYLLDSFNVASLTFFVTFLPAAIFNFLLMPRALARTKNLFKTDWRVICAACGLGAFANLALNKALSLHEASSVVIIGEVFLVLVLAGEHIILKEKEHLWIKLLSILLAIGGAMLILT